MSHRVLIIDDDETDVMFLTRALRSVNVDIDLHHVSSGDEGLTFLQSESADLILLDLKMPGRSGIEVLSSIKVDDRLRHTPVIVVSSSSDRHDVRDSYEHAANAYIMKPDTMVGYQDMAHSIADFWLQKVAGAQ